jgi:hypothetical protein
MIFTGGKYKFPCLKSFHRFKGMKHVWPFLLWTVCPRLGPRKCVDFVNMSCYDINI